MKRRSLAIMAIALLTGGSAAPADVSDPLSFKNAGRCEFNRSGERLLRAMLHQAGESSALAADPIARVGGIELPVRFDETREPDTGFVTYRSSLDFPAGTSWNGLCLVRIAVDEFVPPDIDGLSGREMIFAEPPERVRDRFRRLGVVFPKGDADVFIDKPLGGCEGSIRVEAAGNLTRLRCEWGC